MSQTISHTSSVRPRSQVGSRGTTAPKPAEKTPTRDSVHVSTEAREKQPTLSETSSQVKAMKKNLCPDPSKETSESYQKRWDAAERDLEKARRSGKPLDELNIYKKHCVTPPV